MADDLDDLLRGAMATLDRQVPSGTFDTLAARTLARLDDPALDDLVAEEEVTEDAVIAERDEHSGLQDIRNLASETKARLARRSSQAPIARAELASSSAAWKALALPEPAPGARDPVADARAPQDRATNERGVQRASLAADRPAGEPGASQAASAAIAAPGAPRATTTRRRVALVGAGVAAAAGAMIFLSIRPSGDAPPPGAATAPAPVANAARDVAPSPAPVANPGSDVADRAGAAATARGRDELAASEPRATPPAESIAKGAGLARPIGKAGGGGGGKAKRDPSLEPPVSKPGPAANQAVLPDANQDHDTPAARKGDGQAGATGKAGSGAGSGEPSFDELVREAGITAPGAPRPKLARQALSADDIKRGMTAVAAQAQACFTGTPGLASVRLTVAPSGKITKITTTGPFAGTPTAACVERAVKAATFPPWDGAPQSVSYSYLLSE
jgi:hypothetical protein